MIVKVGQVWGYNDKRTFRTITVIEKPNDLYVIVLCKETGRKSSIFIDRFNPKSARGYTLLEEAK